MKFKMVSFYYGNAQGKLKHRENTGKTQGISFSMMSVNHEFVFRPVVCLSSRSVSCLQSVTGQQKILNLYDNSQYAFQRGPLSLQSKCCNLPGAVFTNILFLRIVLRIL